MVFSVILCICILIIFVGVLFFMETEGGWNFTAVFSSDEIDDRNEQPAGPKVEKGSSIAVVAVADGETKADAVYQNMLDCHVLTRAYEITPYGGAVQCCGYGSCVSVCPQNAISLVKGTAVIGETCNGCGRCVDNCPLHLISLQKPEQESAKKLSFWFKFWKFWFTILRRDQADGSKALWE
ncbi:MAG: hypothetical protein MJ178_00325 [Treponemataceae bacterium]|nr:hypothetical protein [Treponemataceae bacterium]